MHDIPKGAFICIYAGTIFNEETAVDEGKKFGDEYQAELDYIETIQESKEGYESGVEEPDGSVSSDSNDESNDQAKAELLGNNLLIYRLVFMFSICVHISNDFISPS